MNVATRPPGHFARILRLLRTPVHLPGWGVRHKTRRPLPVVIGSSAPLDRVVAPVRAERLPREVPSPSVTMPAAAATPATQPPSRMTRSLEEVRADLARMREQARARAEQAQAHAQALAELRDAERAQRDNSFAPTDFMDFDSPRVPQAPQRAEKPLLDEDLFSSSFAATDFQGLDGGAPSADHDADFGTTAFLPPTAPAERGGSR